MNQRYISEGKIKIGGATGKVSTVLADWHMSVSVIVSKASNFKN